MEEVLRRENLFTALRRVQASKGALGVDGMSVDELPEYLQRVCRKNRPMIPAYAIRREGWESSLWRKILGYLGF